MNLPKEVRDYLVTLGMDAKASDAEARAFASERGVRIVESNPESEPMTHEQYRDLLLTAGKYGCVQEISEQIRANKTYVECLDWLLKNKANATPVRTAEIGLSKKEARQFSFCKALLALRDRNWENAEFEREVSEATAKQLRMSSHGVCIPLDVMQSDPTEGFRLEGQVVGIADKIDTICAVFAEGKKPTGSSDPLGVRRAALGIISTILAGNLNIDLTKLIDETLLNLPVQFEGSSFVDKFKKAAGDCARRISGDVTEEIYEFIIQRLIIYLSDKYDKNVLEACASNRNPLENLPDYIERVKVISTLDCPQLLESANRVARLLKEPVSAQVNKSLFNVPAENMLYEQINTVDAKDDYSKYLSQLVEINPSVEKFFNDVLVMDKDEKVKQNRLALLGLLKQKYDYICDFSKL